MQQQSQPVVQVRRIRPTRLVRRSIDDRAITGVPPTIDIQGDAVSGRDDPGGRPTLGGRLPPLDMSDEDIDISLLDTHHLLQLSGMLRAIQVEKQRTGAFPPISIDRQETAGRIVPFIPLTAVPTPQDIVLARAVQPQPAWKAIFSASTTKVILGLLIGIGLLFLIAHFVNVSQTLHTLQETLTTPQGIALALLSGVAFLTAFSIRGIRWKLFLNPIGKISNFKAVQLFLIGIFLNFLLPVRGGEVAKSLMLKRIAGIPVSQSLPTTVMDRSLDLVPALLIITIVPLLGIQMDIKLWLVLGMVSGLLLGVICFTILAAWKRTMAIKLLQKIMGILPKAIGNKIAGFATGFVDALLAGVSQPKIFLLALLLTGVAVMLDGLFAMLAFWTVGMYIPYTTAIFGYTVYNMFYILPTPPAQVGSNEAAGVLVFSGLLHLNQSGVLAMFVFSHSWAALLMCSTGMLSLSSLGLTISSATKVPAEL